MTVKIINRSKNNLPEYKTGGSAGMDIRADIEQTIEIKPLQRLLIPTGLYMELPQYYEAQIRPRSGMTIKKGLSVANSPGTIDSDYRGEIKIILINLSAEPQEINPGERIAQMVIARYEQPQIVEVQSLSETERGSGGFGSTGVK